MFKVLKARFRLKLRLYLGVSSLEESFVNYRNDNTNEMHRHTYDIKGLRGLTRDNTLAIDILHDTIESVVHIGTDVHRSNGHSWAVVCIEGKMNLVKFVDLERRDARDVLGFLKQFEAGRHCIDAPMTSFFYDNLYKF